METVYTTKLLKIDRADFHPEDLSEACELLKQGELVAFPTETVYGLGGNALDETASARIYKAKGRPSDNPLIVHIADVNALETIGREVPPEAYKLAERFWPGPLTMIVKKSDMVPKSTTGGLDTVAVRMPSDEIALELIKGSGLYIAAPSANASGRPSTTRAGHCMEDLGGKIPMIVDGGPVKIGLESTIVDLSGDQPLILRPGFITIDRLLEVIPSVEYDPAVISRTCKKDVVAKAPGMKYRHYAPKGELVIFEGEPEKVIKRINSEIDSKRKQGFTTAVIATEESKDFYKADYVVSLGRRTDEAEIASHLFEALRSFDNSGADFIFGECFFSRGVGQAIMNRLLKAAGYNIITLDDEMEQD
ncbi:MAG: L-threonylcarbamoyladenylate synthase [Lachnospiraceae bacterium]